MRTSDPLRPMTDAERDLAAANVRIARKMAWDAKVAYPFLDYYELRSAAYLGLCLAAQRWDPKRGPFVACLRWQVRGQVSGVRRDDRPAGFKNLSKCHHETVPTTATAQAGVYTLQVGPEGYTVDRDHVRDLVMGVRKDPDFLLHQIALRLDSLGIDPRTATPAQLKSAIEAGVYKW